VSFAANQLSAGTTATMTCSPSTAASSPLMGRLTTPASATPWSSQSRTSSSLGRQLIAQASKRVLNVGMELGGNAPFLVLADADVDAAVAGAMTAKMRHNPEACIAANRFYVHDSLAEEFTFKFSQAMGALRVGDGRADHVLVGPLASAFARATVRSVVDVAVANGARRLVGGNDPEGRATSSRPLSLTTSPQTPPFSTPSCSHRSLLL
jgi:succinate-semialdehyde dehydrogenase/glutarate-semialdehyde dehydrogenase